MHKLALTGERQSAAFFMLILNLENAMRLHLIFVFLQKKDQMEVNEIGLYDDLDEVLDDDTFLEEDFMEEYESVDEYESENVETRYVKPTIKRFNEKFCKYSNAEKLANSISIGKNERCICVVNGSFIFGDFIEAFIINRHIVCEEMIISTLSMSENNIDSLCTILQAGAVKCLKVIISDYFYSHERKNLIPYMYAQLDIEDRFQLACASVHTKICIFKSKGMFFVIHGSCNLRSSGNIEQFEIEESEELYIFYKDIHDQIIEKYKTINKSVRSKNIEDIIP